MKDKVSGGVWVKASESIKTLPLEQFLYIKDNVNCKRLGNFYNVNGEIKLSICGTEMYESFIVPQNGLHHWFWLDESLTPLAVDNTSKKNYSHDEAIEIIQKRISEIESAEEAAKKYANNNKATLDGELNEDGINNVISDFMAGYEYASQNNK